MNLFCKLGLAIVAGASVLLGINYAENKRKVTINTNGNDNNEHSENNSNTFISEDSNEIKQPKQKKSSNFIKKVKKTQTVVEIISRVVGCIYRICECISDVFGKRDYERRGYYNNDGYSSTTIII